MSEPFGERGGSVRGCLDLACGRFPRFVFGGSTAGILPVFHFHDERREDLEPKLQYLADNGYRTVDADAVAAFVAGEGPVHERAVALCFDDAWASVWTMAGPLLKSFGQRAIVYAIPGRTEDAAGCRPAGGEGPAGGSPFMTWPELLALEAAGTIDVQSHTETHARIFTSGRVVDFVQPGYASTPLLARPLLFSAPSPRFVTEEELGAPLFEQRSRMSDGARAKVPAEVHEACVNLVKTEGGPAFFARSNWRARLEAIATPAAQKSVAETGDEHQRSIDSELDRARDQLNDRLRTRSVRHVCLPWGVSGTRTADALQRLGFRTAFANRFTGSFAVKRGDHPFWLKRLHNRYISRLPGRGRQWWFLAGAAR